MISISVCSFLKNKLQEYGASYIRDIVIEKEQRKEAKRVKKMKEKGVYY